MQRALSNLELNAEPWRAKRFSETTITLINLHHPFATLHSVAMVENLAVAIRLGFQFFDI